MERVTGPLAWLISQRANPAKLCGRGWSRVGVAGWSTSVVAEPEELPRGVDMALCVGGRSLFIATKFRLRDTLIRRSVLGVMFLMLRSWAGGLGSARRART